MGPSWSLNRSCPLCQGGPGAGGMQGEDAARSRAGLYFQRPVTLAFPRVLELQEKQDSVRGDAGQGGG